jgi:formylglycine-generating enzyme required for sulfatase activity
MRNINQALVCWFVFMSSCYLAQAKAYDFALINDPYSQDTVSPRLIWVEGGTMQLGCTNEQSPYCNEDEKPAHWVTISDFSIGQFEVTNAEFCLFLNDYKDSIELDFSGMNPYSTFPVRARWYKPFNGYHFMLEDNQWAIQLPKIGEPVVYKPYPGMENHPVMLVSFLAALKYTEWLSQKTGAFYRLPTEAEWEYAARGGKLSKCHADSCYIYAGSNNEYQVAVTRQTQKVGSKQPNELGIYDMSGNVYEYVLDIYDKNYYSKLSDNSLNPCREYAGPTFIGYDTRLTEAKPQQPMMSDMDDPMVQLAVEPDRIEKELERVIKGGGHVEHTTSWRVSYRDYTVSAEHTIGFRVVKIR